jgi:hypothetical protein
VNAARYPCCKHCQGAEHDPHVDRCISITCDGHMPLAEPSADMPGRAS